MPEWVGPGALSPPRSSRCRRHRRKSVAPPDAAAPARISPGKVEENGGGSGRSLAPRAAGSSPPIAAGHLQHVDFDVAELGPSRRHPLLLLRLRQMRVAFYT
eukprot:ctg_7766.g604